MADPERSVAEQQRHPRSTEAPGGEPEVVRLWLLGAFEVSVGHRSIGEKEWRLKKAGSLLKLLALAPGHRLRREQAMELLWPGLDPEAAANNLHYALHVVRRTLEPAAPGKTASRYLTLREDLLALCPDGPLWVDVEAFERAAATARRSREPAAYRAAVELYVGDLLPEDIYEPWSEEKREQLRRSYHALLLELAGLHEEREEYGPAIETLRRAATEEPSREEAHAVLMRLYALTGRRQEAILQYERLRKALREQLDEEPGAETKRLLAEIRAGKVPAAPSPSVGRSSKELLGPSPNNLPASLTSFVGREEALLEIKRLLSMTRLLALTGVAGSGKTRLALEVARDLLGAYPDGVWLVELALLSDPALTPQAVAAALGVREQAGRALADTLTDHLRAKGSLLVLDNCEHLVDAAAHLAAALLESCPKLRILATSREPLGVPGETVWTVPPLSLPDAGRVSSVEDLISSEAVRLFLDRARSRLPGFGLGEENAGAVGRICRKLEGIPLAIELAAARMGTLAVEQVAQRLDDSLKLLAGGNRIADPRQQTLRATLDWSHALLSKAERRLFGRLSVFAGGWTLEAAEEVCSGEGIERGDVADLLSRLVDKSLVVAGAGREGALRYRMLEPIRYYAQERLQEGENAERVRERHAQFNLALAERVEPELTGPRPVAWLELLETEYGNIRAALSWALDADEEGLERAEMGLRLAAALGRFWDVQSPREGRRRLEKGLAKSGAASPFVRAKALSEAGFIAVYEGDPQALALLEEGLALYRELGDRAGVASSMGRLGHAAIHLGRPQRMVSLRQEVEALLAEPLDRQVRAHLLVFLGFAAGSEGDFEQMKARLEEALALFRESGDDRNVAQCLPSVGMVVLGQGDTERAAALFEEGLLLSREVKYRTAIVYCLMGMVVVAGLRSQPVRVVKLMGASEAMLEEAGLSVTPLDDARYDYEGHLAAARGALGETAFEAAFSEGRAMPLEQAIEYALSREEEPHTLVLGQQPPANEPTERLTSREREVAVLVAQGLTNRRIASELSVSERTVANHVGKILKKLGFSSRARIAAWIARR